MHLLRPGEQKSTYVHGLLVTGAFIGLESSRLDRGQFFTAIGSCFGPCVNRFGALSAMGWSWLIAMSKTEPNAC